MTRYQAFGSTLTRAIWTYELLYVIVGPRFILLIAERENLAVQKVYSNVTQTSCYTGAGYQMSDLSDILTISITTFAAKIIMFITFLFISRLHFNILA